MPCMPDPVAGPRRGSAGRRAPFHGWACDAHASLGRPEVQNGAEALRAGFQSSYSHKSQKDSSHPPSYLPSTAEPRTLGCGPPVQCTETKTHQVPCLDSAAIYFQHLRKTSFTTGSLGWDSTCTLLWDLLPCILHRDQPPTSLHKHRPFFSQHGLGASLHRT